MAVEAKFNTFEVLQIAEKIERNGVVFYHKAAELFESAKLRGMFHKLAEWEGRHEKFFREMRKEYARQINEIGSFNPATYVWTNPQMIEGLAASAIRPESVYALSGKETAKEILEKALEIEKDTVVFYKELKAKVRDLSGVYKIGDIIKEEKRHIMVLNRLLEGL
jgi:rubrerythrin